MKRILTLLLLLISLPVFSNEDTAASDLAVIESSGILNKPAASQKFVNQKYEIRKLLNLHEKYVNDKNLEALDEVYADKYVSFDGFNKKTYFKLVEKSWNSYAYLKYKSSIRNITISGENQAMVETEESIRGLSNIETKYLKDRYGFLENKSKCAYMLEKINGKWKIVSDNIYFEQTTVNYGSAKYTPWQLISPAQVQSGENYDIELKMLYPDKNTVIVGTLDKENITYPHINSEGVPRSLSDYQTLERVVKANTKNINEYAVTLFIIMKTNNSSNLDNLKVQVSGVGMGMNRVNVVPKNKFIRIEDEKISKEHK